MSSQKVFVQFRYCPLCQLNHKKGKKHVFAKRHQEIVTNILVKFLKKINAAKNSLKNPSILESSSDEADRTFWCYFCQREIRKHKEQLTAMGSCVVDQGGILEHLARDDHIENTVKFLKENKKDLVRTSEYILASNDYLKYLEVVDSKCFQYFNEKKESLKLLSQELKSRDWVRGQIFKSGLMEQSFLYRAFSFKDFDETYYAQHKTLRQIVPHKRRQYPIKRKVQNQSQHQGKEALQTCPSTAANRSFTKAGNEEEYRRKTIQAFGDGLTPLDRENEDDTLGNIYTNALPPWLMGEDEGPNGSGIIGPTVEDLEKYRKSEKKRQLPSCRVGAKFDHKHDVTDSWLPNFGGVWSHGRRTNSAQQFNRRQGRQVPSQWSRDMSSQSFSGATLQAVTVAQPSSFSIDSPVTHGTHNIQQLHENNVEPRNEVLNCQQHDHHLTHLADITPSDIHSLSLKPYIRKRKLPETETLQPDSYHSSFNHLNHSNSAVVINRITTYDQPIPIQTISISEISSSGSEFNYSKPYMKKSKAIDHHIDNNNYITESLRLIPTPVLNRNEI